MTEGTKKLGQPDYTTRPTGPKHRQRFLCEVRVEKFDYVGAGNSTNKKDAMANAARDFCSFLVRSGELREEEVPGSLGQNHKQNVFQQGSAPTTLGQEPGERDLGGESSGAVHGNWTLENSKSMLNQFLQTRRIQADYVYSVLGNSFVAEMSFPVRELSGSVKGRGQASNKQTASKTCALSLVRQLYHLKVIEAFSGSLKKSREVEEEKLAEVTVSPEIVRQMENCVRSLPTDPVPVDGYQGVEPLCLSPGVMLDHLLPQTRPGEGGEVTWSPPQSGWDPWRAANIASPSLEQVSEELSRDWRGRSQRENLPIFGMKAEILAAVRKEPVILIQGSTGCGKTTQVCQYILDDWISSGRGSLCSIVCTQPRRISAVSVADRVSAEREEQLGLSTGYSVRFQSVLPRPFGSIMFCTAGVLLRKLHLGLRGVSHVILDEIHERDVNTDFLLVVLRDMVHTFPDLRIILMSATIDTYLFSKYFGDCPVLEVPGRIYPVQEYFLEDCIQMTNFLPEPVQEKNRKNRNKLDNEEDEITEVEERNLNKICSDQYSVQTRQSMALIGEKEVPFDLITSLLDYIVSLKVAGAVLVFLPGWSQISALLRTLQHHSVYGGPSFRLIPLHSQLPREDQRVVFDPVMPGVTKIILSTNIAETSLTIEDVVFVIDSCRVKMKVFTAHNNMTNYTTSWASKTNIKQRRGRAGRVRPGFSFHLVSRARHEVLEEHIKAEIFRTPLQELALTIKLLRLGSVQHFLSKCLEPPPMEAVMEAEVRLREMVALDRNDELTPLGRILAQLPLEPLLGRMVVLGTIFKAGDALTTIASASSTGSEVFMTDLTNGRLTFRQKNFAGDKNSDHLALLNAFQRWESARQGGERAEATFCDRNGLNMFSLRLVWEAKTQLRDILLNCGFPEECFTPEQYNFSGPDPKLDLIVALLAQGLYPNVCQHQEKRRVITADSKIALIHKSSVNCSREAVQFSSPFFVFSEKLKSGVVTCKGMSMVSPIHLMLFACRKIDLMPDMTVKLDGWIRLKMEPRTAALIAAVRPGLESLVLRCARDPGTVSSHEQDETIRLVRQLVNINPATNNMEEGGIERTGGTKRHNNSPGPPAKRGAGFNSMFRGRGFGGFRGGRGGRGGSRRIRGRYHRGGLRGVN